MTHERQGLDRDRGFTLIELIMAVAILGIITATLGGAVYLALKSTSNNYSRLEQSNAEMVVTRYITGDVHQAVAVDDASTANNTPGCVGTTELSMTAFADPSDTTASLTVRWVVGTNGLLRCVYSGSSLTSSMTVTTGTTAFGAACIGSCATAATIRVTFTAAGAGDVAARDVQVDITRRLSAPA